MADDPNLTEQITVFTRSAHLQRYLRSYRLRAPVGTDTGQISQPAVEAAAHADVAMVLYADAQALSKNANTIGCTGTALLAKANAAGISGKLPAVGAEGFITIAASVGGGTIAAGTIIRHTPSDQRYQVIVGGVYVSGQLCPIEGVDTGTTTNQVINTVLDWDEAPPGIFPSATVADNGEGAGLTGGAPEETDAELVQRIIDLRRNPPTAGNTAEYRAACKSIPALAVEEAFAWEAVFAPGTIVVTCTMRPQYLGASRVPAPPQLATLDAALRNAGFPGDDGQFAIPMFEVPVNVQIAVKWTKAAIPWINTNQWPQYVTGSPVRVLSASSASVFTLQTDLAALSDPQVGQVIGVYSPVDRAFMRKQIGAVTVITPLQKWAITCVTTNQASDTSYTPRGDSPGLQGQVVSPWSDSLNLLVNPMLRYFGSLGPGEMYTTFWDPGTRQKRQPESPEQWPHILSTRDISNTPPRAICSDVGVLFPTTAGVSYETPIGSPGVFVNLTVLGDFAVFPKL